MLRSIVTALGTALTVALFAAPAQAQTVCGKRADIVERLGNGFEEKPRSAGLTSNGDLVEIFASEKGTWTIMFTKPGGPTCLIAVGDSWQKIDEPLNLSGKML